MRHSRQSDDVLIIRTNFVGTNNQARSEVPFLSVDVMIL